VREGIPVSKGESRGETNGYKKPSSQWLGTLTRLWRVRKSGMGVMTTVGELVSSRIIDRERHALEDSDFYLDAADMGKGSGRLIARWLKTLHPEHTAGNHFVTLNRAVETIDATCASPLELARVRYIASKVMLAIEGFYSETRGEKPYYELYQQEAKDMLRAFVPGWRRASRRDIFTAAPFDGEAVFNMGRQFLEVLTPPGKEAMQQAFLETYKNPLSDAADYAIQLITLTNGRDDDKALVVELEDWFARYRAFKLSNLDRKQNIIQTGIAAATGQLHWHAGGAVWNRIFGRKKRPAL